MCVLGRIIIIIIIKGEKMKNIILSTTSLFLISTTASFAQSPLTLSGEVDLWGSYTSLDGASYQEEFQTDAEFDARFEMAEDGLTYGANVGAEIDDNNDFAIDEMYGFVGMGAASVKFGKTEGAANAFSNLPTTDLGLLSNGDYESILGNVPMNSLHEINNSGKSEKVVLGYDVDALSVAVSYTPEFAYGVGTYENAVEASANYVVHMDGLHLGVNGTIGSAKGVGLEDYTTWKIGANASVSGVDLGVDYMNGDKFGIATGGVEDDNKTVTLGAGYNLTEKTYVAGNYAMAFGDKLAGGTGNYSDSMNVLGVGVTHSFAPNWPVGSDVYYAVDKASDTIGGTQTEMDNLSIVFGTKLSF